MDPPSRPAFASSLTATHEAADSITEETYNCTTCAPRLQGQSCGQALAEGWVSRHWGVLQRILCNNIPLDISVAEVTDLNLLLDGARTDLIQTLDYEREQHPDANSWLSQNGPLLCQALQENMNSRLLLARITEAHQTATEEMHDALQALQQRLLGSELQSTHEEVDNYVAAPEHNERRSNEVITVYDSDDDEEVGSYVSAPERRSNEVIIVYDSDDDDGSGVASMITRRHEQLAGHN